MILMEMVDLGEGLGEKGQSLFLPSLGKTDNKLGESKILCWLACYPRRQEDPLYIDHE